MKPRGSARPFSRPIDTKRVPEGGLDQRLVATEEECAAVAADLGLPRIATLSAQFAIDRRAGGRFQLSGEVTAEVTQVCVVTLEAFDSAIEQPVEVTFAPADDTSPDRAGRAGQNGRGSAARVAVAVSAEGDDAEDPPDPLVDDTIDLGIVATEFLALALDPYPRKPGVVFQDTAVGEKDEPRPSAFAALERLKAGS